MTMVNNYYHSYLVYGLKIRSAVELTGLFEVSPAESSIPDVEIVHQSIQDSDLERYFETSSKYDTRSCVVRASERAMAFTYNTVGTIMVVDGNKVILDLLPGVREDEVMPYLTGYVLAVLLHQRKYLVLHASVMVINGIGVAFLGSKGQGKSTLAASLEVLGNKLISDDLLPIFFEDNRIFTFPGYPHIKLFEDSVLAIGSDPAQLPLVHRRNIKRSYSCNDFSGTKIPLSVIYVLNLSESVSIEGIGSAEAFVEATTHTYVNAYLRESNSQSRHFEQCLNLLASIPFFRLNRPHDYDRLPETSQAIIDHLDHLVFERSGLNEQPRISS